MISTALRAGTSFHRVFMQRAVSVAETARLRIPGVLFRCLLLPLCVSCGPSLVAAAHPVSVTRTLVYVAPDRVDVTIEVFLEDLYLFHNLQPDDSDFLNAATIRQGIELHRTFVAERFVIQDADGVFLVPDEPPLVSAAIPDAGVSLAELMAHRLTFELRYSCAEPADFLTFEQQFTDTDGVLPSEMQLLVRSDHADEIINQALVPHSPTTVRFDWTSPPLSPDASAQERERWTKQQQDQTLGITSYSSVYSFLYIENDEIRHEILIPLLTLEPSLPLPREQRHLLTVPEQDAVRPEIEQFFATGNPLEVDGAQRVPSVERCDFYGVDFRDFAQRTKRKSVAMSSARVGIILTYPLAAPPRQLRLTWDRFHQSLWAVSMVVLSGDAAFRRTLSRVGKNNVFEWTGSSVSVMPVADRPQPVVAELPLPPMIRVPVAAVVLLAVALVVALRAARSRFQGSAVAVTLLLSMAAATWTGDSGWVRIRRGLPPEISDDEARRVITQLLENVYGAFRFRGEHDVYEALAVSTSGELLQDLYLQIREGLVMAEQGGAVARVRRVDVIDAERRSPQKKSGAPSSVHAFGCRCRWNISGTVEHWGHIHERTNQFEAEFLAEPVSAALHDGRSSNCHWKLTQVNVLNSERVHFETRLRNVDSRH